MDRHKQLEIFHWQTANVRKLDTAFKHVRRVLNSALLRNDLVLLEVQTKTLAFLYSCWTEALFYKLIHTPHCFSLGEIAQIKRQVKSTGITGGWQKAVQLSLRRINARSGDIPNRKQRIERLLRQYIEQPSQLRNRIAHGQWENALNSDGTERNSALSDALKNIDFLQIERLRAGCTALAAVIESLVESPNKAFHADYYSVLANSEQTLREMSRRTISDHLVKLKAKQPKAAA